MKYSTQIVVLPTEDETRVVDNHGRLCYFKVKPIGVTKHTIPQYLYATISQDVEPIKEGDWHIFNGNFLTQATNRHGELVNPFNRRKIIATTDPKIYAGYSTPGITFVPQLQQSFLKEFVANPDGEWEVEYLTGHSEDRLKINQDNTVNITSVEEKMYSREEVVIILHNCYKDTNEARLSDGYMSSTDWIKENLK